jgi:hypothetical protein
MTGDVDSRVCVLACALAAGARLDLVLSPSRKRCAVIGRIAAAVLLRERGMSLAQIGRRLGFRHHTTVMHCLVRAKEMPEAVGPILERARAFIKALQQASQRTTGESGQGQCGERGCPMPAVMDGCCRRHWHMRHDRQPFEQQERISAGSGTVGPVKVPLPGLGG